MKSTTLFVLSISILLGMGCSDAALKQELADTQAKLAEAQQSLADTDNADDIGDIDSPLVHLVYLKLQPDADVAQVTKAIYELKKIEVVYDLEVGVAEDLGDARALDYQLMMSMEFKNEADYKTYQAHETHLALRESLQDFLAAPPATFDYIEQNRE